MTTIGFLGLGIMGVGMVRNLLNAGHAVTAWNRSERDLPADLTESAAFRVAADVADAVAAVGTVIVCVTGPEAQRAILPGQDGAFANAAAGTTVIDATTSDPALTADLAEEAAAAGLVYLDCPVFGSRNEAWNGALDFVCGGPADAFERIRPLLEPMANSVHHMGPVTTGAAMKLVGNLFVAAQMMSLGEGLSLAQKAGLDPDAVMGVLDVADYSSPLIRGVGRASLARDFSPHFYLKHMLKDARLIGDFAQRLGVPTPASAVIAELYQAAVNRGLGNLNASGLHKMMFRQAGIDE